MTHHRKHPFPVLSVIVGSLCLALLAPPAAARSTTEPAQPAPVQAQPMQSPAPVQEPVPTTDDGPFDKHRFAFYLGPHGSGTIVLSQETDAPQGGYLSHGGGFGVVAGFRVVPYFAIEAKGDLNIQTTAFDWNYVDFYHMHTWGVRLRFHIPLQLALDPYIVAGGGYTWLGRSYKERQGSTTVKGRSLVAEGASWNVGVGLDWWMSRRFTLGGRIVYQGISFGESSDPSYPYSNVTHSLLIVFIPSWHW
jgi:hypothetical protein